MFNLNAPPPKKKKKKKKLKSLKEPPTLLTDLDTAGSTRRSTTQTLFNVSMRYHLATL